jgi:hypothetical protein
MRWHAPGPGLRTTNGGGATVSRATAERERECGDEKFLSVARESAGLKIFVHET